MGKVAKGRPSLAQKKDAVAGRTAQQRQRTVLRVFKTFRGTRRPPLLVGCALSHLGGGASSPATASS